MSKKAGQRIVEHDSLRLDMEDDIIEYRRQMESEIMNNIYNTVSQAKNADQYLGKNFYIVLITIVDRVLRSARTICVARISCPTPVYKQSVWKYHRSSDSLEFLWSIPDSLLYYTILRNKDKYLMDKECADLAKFVILMESGELLEWVKKENGEKRDAVIKIQEQQESECLMN